MKKEIFLRKRVLFLECDNKYSCAVHDDFLELLKELEYELSEIMDNYDVPEKIILSFKKRKDNLIGIYHTQEVDVRKHVIVIDIYVEPMPESMSEVDLLDTFVHEIVHNKIRNEKKTLEETKKIMLKLRERI